MIHFLAKSICDTVIDNSRILFKVAENSPCIAPVCSIKNLIPFIISIVSSFFNNKIKYFIILIFLSLLELFILKIIINNFISSIISFLLLYLKIFLNSFITSSSILKSSSIKIFFISFNLFNESTNIFSSLN